jgi:hypothetical protein
MSIQTNPSNKPVMGAQIVQLSVVVVVVAVLAYVVLTFVAAFIYWILAVLTVLVVAIHYRWLWSLVLKIRDMYTSSFAKGLAATVGAMAIFTPFVGFLFLKTIWDFRNSDFIPRRKSTALPPTPEKVEDATFVEVKKE